MSKDSFIVKREEVLVIVTKDNIDVIKPGSHRIYDNKGTCRVIIELAKEGEEF